jgi:hypothetical protein
MPVQPSGDAEGIGFGDRLVEEIDKRVLDARVLDAGRRKQKSHAASESQSSGVY